MIVKVLKCKLNNILVRYFSGQNVDQGTFLVLGSRTVSCLGLGTGLSFLAFVGFLAGTGLAGVGSTGNLGARCRVFDSLGFGWNFGGVVP